MAKEVVMEKDFPCPCGKGILRIQVLEHDVWANGRHSRWSLLCEQCHGNYREPLLEHVLISRKHYEYMEKKSHELYEKRRAVGRKAVERYLSRFSEHVKSLKFKTAMHDAVGSGSSIDKFRKQTRYGDGLDRAIEQGLEQNPARALKRIKVEDAEIVAELEAIAREQAALTKFFAEIPKHPIPDSHSTGQLLNNEVPGVTAKHWAMFSVVQTVGIALVAVSNIHTNVLPFIIGYLLLAPGIFVSSKLDLGGSAQGAIIAVLINAAVWYFVARQGRRKGNLIASIRKLGH